jgi:lysophospholipase L1-like esterase
MDLRTRDRLTTAADVAPWVVAVVSLVAVGLPMVRGLWPGSDEQVRSVASPAVVATGPVVVATDPYQPGQSLPEGFGPVDASLVQVDQKTARTKAARVVIVGDSLTVGASPGLRSLLSDVNLRIDAKVGRSMPEGSRVTAAVKASTADIVVVALGSNDSCDVKECTRRVNAILAAANPSAPLIWMLPAQFRPNMENVRTAVQQVLARRPRSIILDWQPYEDDHPEIVQADGIHLTPAGYRLRAEVTANQIHSLLGR